MMKMNKIVLEIVNMKIVLVCEFVSSQFKPYQRTGRFQSTRPRTTKSQSFRLLAPAKTRALLLKRKTSCPLPTGMPARYVRLLIAPLSLPLGDPSAPFGTRGMVFAAVLSGKCFVVRAHRWRQIQEWEFGEMRYGIRLYVVRVFQGVMSFASLTL